jgi:HYR domain
MKKSSRRSFSYYIGLWIGFSALLMAPSALTNASAEKPSAPGARVATASATESSGVQPAYKPTPTSGAANKSVGSRSAGEPIAAAAAPAPPKPAGAMIMVTTLDQEVNSDGDCSLQEAIFAANFDDNKAIDPTNLSNLITTGCTPGSGDDTIVLAPNAVYQLSSLVQEQFNPMGTTANPMIFTNITIEGNGARLERVGGTNVRAFAVNGATTESVGGSMFSGSGNLTLRNLHIKGFSAHGGNGSEGGGGGLGAGGAVYNRGTLTVEKTTFEGNTATGGNGSSQTTIAAGGGGGGMSSTATGGNDVEFGSGNAGGGGGGSRGRGGNGANSGGGGGGTANNGVDGASSGAGGNGGFNCGGKGGDSDAGQAGAAGFCEGGGGGGGGRNLNGNGGAGGAGNYGGGGGGGGGSNNANGGPGGAGGFGGGGGSGSVGGSTAIGGAGGFGGGGGAGGDSSAAGGGGGRFAGSATSASGGGGAGLGAAIFNDRGNIFVHNSTFHNNQTQAGTGGSGAADGGSLGIIFTRNGTALISNSTFSDNSDIDVATVGEGGTATLELRNNILANSMTSSPNCETFFFAAGSVTQSNSGNLIEVNGVASGTTAACAGVVSSADPALGPLALNAPGLTPTMAISQTSPAFDTGDNAHCEADDQRGVLRPQGMNCDIGAYEVEPCTAITCPANIAVDNDPAQCGAVVNYAAPTPTGECGTITCSPASGSFFPVGMTTVTCTSEFGGQQCMFTVTVNDVQKPVITCPANITAVAPTPGTSCVPVNFIVTATDNCPGVTIQCIESGGGQVVVSGFCFPPGITTVNCTATDASGNTAGCAFTVTVFDVCVQDDSSPGNVLEWSSKTGDYRFCCKGTVFTGKGTATRQGNIFALVHYAPDRRVVGKLDAALNRGSAAIQFPPGVVKCSITDRNTKNNSCMCQ